MTKSFGEAFKVAKAAEAAKVAKAAEKGAVKVISTNGRAAPAVDDWALRLLSVMPLPADLRQQLGTEVVEVMAAAKLSRVDRKDVSHVEVDSKDRPKLVLFPLQQPVTLRHTAVKQTTVTKFHGPSRSTRSTSRGRVAPSLPCYPHLQPHRVLPSPVVSSVKLVIAPGAKLNWNGGRPVTASLLRQSAEMGRRAQLFNGKAASMREVVMGFDFGTSSAKVVFGDWSLKEAYAVPFRDAPGISAFLLPARLYEDVGRYSLHGGPLVLNDLKLSLMANPDDAALQTRVVGYLALAIREARGWLFTTHAETYAKTQIVWTLALGQPADQATAGALTQLFQRLGWAAWKVAGDASEVTSGLCAEVLRTMADAPAADTELRVIVMPEIAAQIYGFVTSDQFDPNSRNIFLIADVGAGTVDSCLFRVVPVRGGSWKFQVYTTAVEPTGVMNLHRHRVAWWQRQLALHPQGAELIEQLETVKLATEHQADIPDSYLSYLKGVTVNLSGKSTGPDEEFFKIPLVRQVRGRTLVRVLNTELLGKAELVNVPFILCGGGSRLGFYRELRTALHGVPGIHSMGAQSREMSKPKNLRADGVVTLDYDRLSVAYGLSMLDLDNVTDAAPIPRLTPQVSDQWRLHYVDKDHC
ncbi:MAG: hypothetical protein H7274_09360 [Rhodoferax sp.]|nr:hypothetical protein [Rhodoferax sp.]